MKRFENRRAVVTGASSGVSKAIALALAREGGQVALVGRTESKVQAVAAAARSGGGQTEAFTAEFCDDASVGLLGTALARSYAELDFLVHSAGVIKLASIAQATLADFDTQFRCNVRAPFALTQQLLPALIARRGTVVFINSTVVGHARAGLSQYAATKHALKAIADSLRDEVNKNGVRVLSVFLGRTATPMQESVHAMEGRRYDASQFIQPEEAAEVVLNALASGRSVELTNIELRPALPPT